MALISSFLNQCCVNVKSRCNNRIAQPHFAASAAKAASKLAKSSQDETHRGAAARPMRNQLRTTDNKEATHGNEI